MSLNDCEILTGGGISGRRLARIQLYRVGVTTYKVVTGSGYGLQANVCEAVGIK